MKIVVLLSQGAHPVSGRACPVAVEAQAIRLARDLGAADAALSGLHAGADFPALRDYCGHGLRQISVLAQAPQTDPVPALAHWLRDARPDLILAGRRGQGWDETGLLPYRLAASLGLPLCADAAGLALSSEGLAVSQALPRGARRRVTLALPAIVTVHPAAPPAFAFAHAAARRGEIDVREAGRRGGAWPEMDEKPYRRRPVYLGDPAASAGGASRLMLDPDPEDAAEAILEKLAGYGLLPVGGKAC